MRTFLFSLFTNLLSSILAFLITWGIIETRIKKFMSLREKSKILTVNIRDLTQNIWLTIELLKNPTRGTEARYWLDGLRVFHRIYDCCTHDAFATSFHLIHMLEIDNNFLEKGNQEKATTNAQNVVVAELLKFQSVLEKEINEYNFNVDNFKNGILYKIYIFFWGGNILEKINYCPTRDEIMTEYEAVARIVRT